MNFNLYTVAAALGITNSAAFIAGYLDGKEQGFHLTVGMSYDDLHSQWAYDVGTHIGACAAVHPDSKETA